MFIDVSSCGETPIPSTSSKRPFTHLVTQSTFLIIVIKALKKIIRTESLFIKLR